MDKVGLVLEQFVDAFYYISLAQHHLVPQGHKLVFHVRLEPVNEMDALAEEVLKEFLLDVPPVGKYFAVEHFGLMLWHTEIIVLSTKLMPVHFPKPWMRMKAIRSKNTQGMSSTKHV